MARRRTSLLLSSSLLAGLLSLGCGSQSASPDADCTGFKCDIPDGPAEEMCLLRRTDAFNENQLAFREEFLRWSCADVEGVTNEDRGQEYCEYFALVALPPESADGEPPATAILGRNLGPNYSYGTTEQTLDLSFHQITELEADESAIAGQCIFTTWNSDIEEPVAACETQCPEILGVAVESENFRMKFDVNSAEAAQILAEDCYTIPRGGDPENTSDPMNDEFYRACMHNEDINATAFRKSDTTVCSAFVRLAECGCAPVDPAVNLGEAISPWDRRGFPLGTWSSPSALPSGCRFVDIGEDSQTIVSCDLTAGEVISASFDLKGYCMQKYGDNVVVHVPLPPRSAVQCSPDSGSNPYTSTCTDTPWILEDRY